MEVGNFHTEIMIPHIICLFGTLPSSRKIVQSWLLLSGVYVISKCLVGFVINSYKTKLFTCKPKPKILSTSLVRSNEPIILGFFFS